MSVKQEVLTKTAELKARLQLLPKGCGSFTDNGDGTFTQKSKSQAAKKHHTEPVEDSGKGDSLPDIGLPGQSTGGGKISNKTGGK